MPSGINGDGRDDILLQSDYPGDNDVIAYTKAAGGRYEAMARSALPAVVNSLQPVRIGGELMLASMAAPLNGTITTRIYRLR